MFMKKYLLRLSIYLCASILYCSCSSDLNEAIDNSLIDLNLVNENNWQYSEEIFQLINQYRLSINKTPLVMDSLYATAYAVDHSRYMIETVSVNHNNFIIRSEGLKNQGASKVGENIAFGYYSANSVFNAWLNSESHLKIIEDSYTHVGFGILKSSKNNKYYYTLLFYE